jgi:hypothetical protein
MIGKSLDKKLKDFSIKFFHFECLAKKVMWISLIVQSSTSLHPFAIP